MRREIKYKAIESYGDCTTKFEIQGVEGMKVSEFISYIISNRLEDSGTFSIDGVKFPYDNKRGRLSINTYQAPCHLTIASVTAYGAYWQMDYEISTKNTTKTTMEQQELNFTKKCNVCGRELPATENYFYRNSSNRDGFQNQCKECRKKRNNEIRRAKRLKSQPLGSEDSPLARFTPRELMKELKARGYDGELTFVQKIKLSQL